MSNGSRDADLFGVLVILLGVALVALLVWIVVEVM